jgi:hypothetical protein
LEIEGSVPVAYPRIQASLDQIKGYTALISERYWRDENARRQLILWLGVGIFLRVLLMPFTASNDYLDSHWRSEQMAERAVPYPTRTQFLSHAVDAAWLVLLTPVLPNRASVFAAPHAKDGRLDARPEDFARFVSNSSVHWALFSTKLIYLILDLVTGILLLRLFSRVERGLYAFKLWMINPAMLYGVFIYGRYEVYAIFFLVLSLLLAQRQRALSSALAVGLAIAFRSTPILLLPIYTLILARQRLKQLLILILGILPQLFVTFVMEIGLGLHAAYDVDHATGALSMLTNAAFSPVTLFPFLICYTLLLLWLDRQQTSYLLLASASLAVYLLMYALAWHSPHYMSWLAPFIIPLLAYRPEWERYYWILLLAWAIYWALVPNSGVFTTYVFSPLFGHLQLSTPPGEIAAAYSKAFQFDQNQLGIAARSVLSAIAIWMLYLLHTIEPERASDTAT